MCNFSQFQIELNDEPLITDSSTLPQDLFRALTTFVFQLCSRSPFLADLLLRRPDLARMKFWHMVVIARFVKLVTIILPNHEINVK